MKSRFRNFFTHATKLPTVKYAFKNDVEKLSEDYCASKQGDNAAGIGHYHFLKPKVSDQKPKVAATEEVYSFKLKK